MLVSTAVGSTNINDISKDIRLKCWWSTVFVSYMIYTGGLVGAPGFKTVSTHIAVATHTHHIHFTHPSKTPLINQSSACVGRNFVAVSLGLQRD